MKLVTHVKALVLDELASAAQQDHAGLHNLKPSESVTDANQTHVKQLVRAFDLALHNAVPLEVGPAKECGAETGEQLARAALLFVQSYLRVDLLLPDLRLKGLDFVR